MKNDKLKVVLIVTMTGILALVASIVLLPGDLSTTEMIMVLTAVVIAIGALYFVKDKMSAMKQGLPTDDEMSKKIVTKAGAWSYYFTIWLAVALLWTNNMYFKDVLGQELKAVHVIGAIVLIPGIFFIATVIVLKKRGVE